MLNTLGFTRDSQHLCLLQHTQAGYNSYLHNARTSYTNKYMDMAVIYGDVQTCTPRHMATPTPTHGHTHILSHSWSHPHPLTYMVTPTHVYGGTHTHSWPHPYPPTHILVWLARLSQSPAGGKKREGTV